MAFIPTYDITNEYNLSEMLEHFDSEYIFDVINNKLNNIDFASILPEPNITISFENTFKAWDEKYPGDTDNVRLIREQVYTDIINAICNRFNLRFNAEDDNINRFTAAYYLYDFLVCHRVTYMVNFFTSFIINNKADLVQILSAEDYKRNKDSASTYSKQIYTDQTYGLISANIEQVLGFIAELDITLYNIFQSIYANPSELEFLDNAFADKGNFFKDFYASILDQPENLPIVIVNIRLALQNLVGNINSQSIQELMVYNDIEQQAQVQIEQGYK